ncbi:MAG TPA: glycosyltransferase family 4 protein [Terriglobales bacterium]|nr:glycosyltransferase family 4 protein [Terriglobales bacterium]
MARPLGHDALGWAALRRAGMRAAERLAPQGARVIVNGGNCPWPDVNWVHYLHAAYFAPLAGSPARRLWQKLKHQRALADEQRALRRARVVIANSEATRREIVARLGVAPERVHTVYYGADPQVLTPITAGDRAAARAALGWAPERRVVLFVGALGDRRKGFDTLFAAWQAVCADPVDTPPLTRVAPDGRSAPWLRSPAAGARSAPGASELPRWEADLVVVGRGAELEAWRARATAHAAVAGRIRFLGRREDVPRLLAASDLMVAPTRYEAYGLAVHEAWARALPALVSAAAGVAERCLPELRGRLLLDDPEDAVALAARLRTWGQSPESFAAPMRELSRRLHAHTWDDMAATVIALATGERGATA